MKKFQIVEVTEELNHAGTKATADIAVIASKLGFKRLNIRMDTSVESSLGKVRRQVGYFRDWRRALSKIEEGSVLLLQHPFHHKQLTREKTLREMKSKNIKIISLVHDVEELRAFRYDDYYKHEFNFMLEFADKLIVHNNVMKQWFIDQGVDEKRLISLEIFDYLQKADNKKEVQFEKSITVAGNLDTTKCGYIGQLGQLSRVKVHLYGPNYNDALSGYDNIEYHGSFPADEIPEKLVKGFGLVWDGSSIDGCRGLSGQYLKYNNPHKLSLYLSSGMPVVIWKEAAEAKFVNDNGVGLTVDKLTDVEDILSTMTEKEWEELKRNTRRTGRKLRSGFYGKAAIESALMV